MEARFTPTTAPNPHIGRARAILRAHPEVRRYVGPYRASALWIAGLVALQVGLAAWLRDASWPFVLLCAYALGAFVAHALFVLIHEATHNLVTGRPGLDRWWGIACNLGQAFPSAMSFRTFHLLHHARLDEYDYDADLAFDWEARFVGNSAWRKALWLLVFPVVEVLRPLRVRRKLADRWLWINAAVVVAFDVALLLALGPKALAFVACSTLFGLGLHPLGARWIQEHYVFREGQETYSYYGPLNRLAFNIGYHNEHHDLTCVPWVHLPQVKALAPEFYDELHAHRSWLGVLRRFVFDPNVTLFSRITRERGAKSGRVERRAA